MPIGVKVGYDYQALIITGPNTGGKTVVLKTVGLLTAMTMCGLLIPADDGSTVSVFRNILADIGDQQSIEQSLSTFSSHMNHIVDILKVADEHSLILLDELGSGTDPVEGAALAVSIIETLLEQGSRLMVTTHYQELKLYAIEHENVQNASCEFNIETLQPTYRLIIGSPGKSNAFAISSKLGISDDIIKRASALIDTETRRFEEVIERLEHTRIQLENEQAELSAIKNDTQKKNQQLSEELDKLQKTKNDELEKARNQAMQIVESVRSQSDELIDELNTIRKEKEKENFSQLAIQAKSKSKSTLDKLYKEANPVIDTNSSYQLPRKLRKGDNVLITDINKKGIVTTEPDNNGFVFIQSGLMKTKINIKKLRLLEPENKKPDKKSKISTKNITSKIERKGCMELDIRGYACDDGLHELDMFIDNAVMSNMGIVTIIHGKGTGILRAAVHRSLKAIHRSNHSV